VPTLAFEHPTPWTEPEYWALGETLSRVELVDGCLWLSPHPGTAQQEIRHRLVSALRESARVCGLRAVGPTNLRLSAGRITNPDLAVGQIPRQTPFSSAADVALVGEVVDEHSTVTDRILKRELYAAAGIDWYLLAEPSLPEHLSVRLRLLRRAGDHYVKHATADYGQTLKANDPFPFEIPTTDLLDLP
jgi:Uma2 family endonuclease